MLKSANASEKDEYFQQVTIFRAFPLKFVRCGFRANAVANQGYDTGGVTMQQEAAFFTTFLWKLDVVGIELSTFEFGFLVDASAKKAT